MINETPIAAAADDAACQAISERLAAVRASIAEAEAQAGCRTPVTLMAVTKTIDADRINYAIDREGIRCIGENRVQELCAKYPLLHLSGVSVHLIGSLQANKVKYIIDKVDMIHALDSVSLAKEIEKQAEKHGRIMDCLIEINIGREESKGGILPEELFSFYDAVKDFPHLRIRGLMTIAPNSHDHDRYMQYFSETRTLFDALSARLPEASAPPVLSMGMSDSYREAILCGSGLVRIGSGIFGPRT